MTSTKKRDTHRGKGKIKETQEKRKMSMEDQVTNFTINSHGYVWCLDISGSRKHPDNRNSKLMNEKGNKAIKL